MHPSSRLWRKQFTDNEAAEQARVISEYEPATRISGLPVPTRSRNHGEHAKRRWGEELQDTSPHLRLPARWLQAWSLAGAGDVVAAQEPPAVQARRLDCVALCVSMPPGSLSQC